MLDAQIYITQSASKNNHRKSRTAISWKQLFNRITRDVADASCEPRDAGCEYIHTRRNPGENGSMNAGNPDRALGIQNGGLQYGQVSMHVAQMLSRVESHHPAGVQNVKSLVERTRH